MNTASVEKLVRLLEAFIATSKAPAKQRARSLRAKQKKYDVAPQAAPPGVQCPFYDGHRATVFLMKSATSVQSHVLGECTCRVGPKAQPCGHVTALARVLSEYASRAGDTWMAPMVQAMDTRAPQAQLDRLDALLSPLTPTRRASESHLHWVLTTRRDGRILGELRIRDRVSSGKFGKSKVLGNSRYLPMLRESVHPQDRVVARRFVLDLRQGGADSLRGRSAELLELLAGHPDIHLGDFPNPVQVTNEGVTLRLREDGADVVLEPTVAGLQVTSREITLDGAIVIADPRRARIVVARPEENILEFVMSLGNQGLRLPLEFAPRVIDRLREVTSDVTLDLPEHFSPTNTPADERLRLSVVNERDTWVARLLVRPLAGGPEFPPGEGNARVNATVGGDWKTTIRRLDDERAGARRLLDELNVPMTPPSWTTVLPIDALLELAVKVKGRKDILIEWPQRMPKLLASRAQLRIQVEKKRDWFGVEGTAVIDGVEVTLAHLLALRRENKRFVEIGTDRFVDLAQIFDNRLQKIAEATRVEQGKLILSHSAAPDAPELFEGVDELRASTDWQALTERARAIRTFEPTVPTSLEATPRDYQTEGFRWMRRLAELGLGACLADDMGLGKTLQAITMLVDRAVTGPALVVAPTSVAFNWEREIRRFAPALRPLMLREGNRKQLIESAGAGDVIICSWGLLRHEEELLKSRNWHTLVFDEAQAIKNWSTDTAKVARRIPADWRLALTGTPVENHLGELFSILETVIPGLFGSWDSFQARFANPIERFGNKDVQRALSRLVKPFVLRRTKAQVASELPERTEVRLDVELTKLERRLYEAARISAVRAMEVLANDITGRFQVLAEITRLRQLASSAHLVDPAAPRESSKTKVLIEQIEELVAEDRACLVFSQFTRQLALVSEALDSRGIEHLTLTGATPAKAREKLVDQFQRGEAKVFLISLKAGGTGLNLTQAETVFLLDPWWNPAVEDQAADRAHRIGQTRRVTVVRLVSLGTIEEKVIELHAAKRALVEGVLGDADLAAKLSTSDLVDLMQGPDQSDDDDFEAEIEINDMSSASEWTHEQVIDALHERWQRKFQAAVVTTYENSLRVIFAAGPERRAPLPTLLSTAIDDYMPYAEAISATASRQQHAILESAFTELQKAGHLSKQQRDGLAARVAFMNP